ncbi:MAG: AGE family epimerase/isomerase [Alphaproteobacteria bacterium]|nr:AGE family epimerase/isomerase [Alphaproteobacteria bacterium]
MTRDAEQALCALAGEMQRWLFDAALPLWSERGRDPDGGIYESLNLDGSPSGEARRARVQARQSYVYALAGELGWQGPWQEMARHAFDYLVGRYRASSGLFCTLVSDKGEVIDPAVKTYDQAFVLLALSQLLKTGVALFDPEEMARDVRTLLLRERHDRNGGFLEDAEPAHLSNPNMHMLEASLAWCRASNDPVWPDTVAEIAGLATRKLIRPLDSALPEYFDANWSPLPVNTIEPGHQFEWAWLLGQTRDEGLVHTIEALYAAGARGVDPVRGVALDRMDANPATVSARLWPQTERARAALMLAQWDSAQQERYLKDALDAGATIKRYLDTPLAGQWRDRMLPDGSFVNEPAPASSLYHLIGWIKELLAFAARVAKMRA